MNEENKGTINYRWEDQRDRIRRMEQQDEHHISTAPSSHLTVDYNDEMGSYPRNDAKLS
jgi:hypothetical protein